MALEGAGPPLRYAELAARAATLRDELERAGVAPGEPVALLTRARGHDEPVALAGVLAAGAVAVPLEAAAPAARLAAVARARGVR
ncbi:MAG: AMP-binding protein, partial [Myxococcales bacterium]|nr:AMP-binding protein [Myxococcales bacterium]